jgi:flagellar basal-body rod protein FlgF
MFGGQCAHSPPPSRNAFVLRGFPQALRQHDEEKVWSSLRAEKPFGTSGQNPLGIFCRPQRSFAGFTALQDWHTACPNGLHAQSSKDGGVMDNTINIALSRLSVQQRAMEMIAGNLANTSTPGFRAERMVFADWLTSQSSGAVPAGDRKLAFTQVRATYRDQSEGSITPTNNPLDLALTGNGFFTVQTANGTRLTRAGRFSLQGDGSITDESGNPLLDTNGAPMRISPADTQLTVKGDGSLNSENGPLGQIAVVTPNDPNRLTAEGGRLFRADVPTTPVTAPKVIQGALEESNVQPITEVTRMISTERDFQFVAQFVEAEGQRKQSAIDKMAAAPTS